jgi:Uma2 family endonuclease
MVVPKLDENKYYTLDEYLAFEELAEEKYEYHAGRLFAMAGGTGNHGLISNSIGTALDIAIDKKGKNCSVFSSDVKVRIERFDKAIYPDASVICGTPEYTNKNQTLLVNPILLIEVLSKSTKDYDIGKKFEMYRSIPSFKEYMIVYQTVAKVQTWYKEAENLWRIANVQGLENEIYLHSIDCTIALKDIYKRIQDLQEIDGNELEVY